MNIAKNLWFFSGPADVMSSIGVFSLLPLFRYFLFNFQATAEPNFT